MLPSSLAAFDYISKFSMFVQLETTVLGWLLVRMLGLGGTSLRTSYLSVYSVLRKQYTVPRTQYPVNSTRYPVHRTPYTVPRTQYTVPRTQYTVHRTQYPVHRIPYTIQRTPYSVHSTPYTVHRTPYSVHRTPYTVHRLIGDGLCMVNCMQVLRSPATISDDELKVINVYLGESKYHYIFAIILSTIHTSVG